MNITPELLDKYRRGECTDDEYEAVEAWFAQDETLLPDFAMPDFVDEHSLKDRVWDRLAGQVGSGSKEEKVIPNVFGRLLWPGRFAAALVLACGIGYLMFLQNKPVKKNAAVGYRTISVPLGQKGSFRLRDGTLVFLNSGSQLKFPRQFSDTSRAIQLTGEAFLSVTKDAKRPFTVETARANIRVLGTRFNVKAYAKEATTSVIVEEGKVRLSVRNNPEDHLILTANQRGQLTETGHFRESNVYMNAYVGWKENKLVFDNQKLSEISVILERWYGVKVDIRSRDLPGYRYSGTYDNPSLESLIHNLCFVLKCNYKIADKTVTIY